MSIKFWLPFGNTVLSLLHTKNNHANYEFSCKVQFFHDRQIVTKATSRSHLRDIIFNHDPIAEFEMPKKRSQAYLYTVATHILPHQ